MLNSIRRGVSSWVVKILLGLLILSFAVWGIGDIFFFSGSNPAVATVGGEEITTAEFVTSYQRDVESLSNRLGRRISPDEGRQFGLVRETVSRLVIQKLLDETAADYGVTVGNDVLRETVFGNEAFQDATGRFDAGRFQQLLASNGLTEEEYVASLRRSLERDQILSSVSVGAFAPAPLVQPIYEHRNEARIAQIAVLDAENMPDPGAPDDAALQKFYEENQARYMAPEYRALAYVWVSPETLMEEIAVTEAEVQDVYEARADRYFQPERRALEQLVYDNQEAALAARERIVAGESFAAVADETGAINQGATDLGTLAWEDLPEDLGNAVFALEEDVVSEPLQSAFGYHIVRVSEIVPEGTRPLDEVRAGIEEEIRYRRAVDGLQDLVDRLEDEMAGGRTLEEAAAQTGLEAREIEAVDARGFDREGEAVQDVPDLRSLVETAFQSEPGRVGAPEESADGGYFFVRVDEVTPEQVRPLENIRDVVVADWQDAQRLAAAEAAAAAIVRAVGEGTPLEEAARAQGARLVESEPLTRSDGRAQPEVSPAIVSGLFEKDVGDVVSGPTGSGDGYAVARLIEIVDAAPQPDDEALARLRQALNASVARDILEQYQIALQREVGISVNQGLLETLDLNTIPAAPNRMPQGLGF